MGISPWWIYLVQVIGGFSYVVVVALIIALVFMLAFGVLTVCGKVVDLDDEKENAVLFGMFLLFAKITVGLAALYIFVPSPETMRYVLESLK